MIYKCISINNYNNDNYKKFYNELSYNDKIKTDKLINSTLKKQSILSKHILATLLKKHYNIDYHNTVIKYNQFGKPYINNINYNISHSHNYVLVAISNNLVGVDIEKIRKVNLNIMFKFCTPNECNYINNSKNKYLSFFQIFTLKEAYFKMLGTNLANPKSIEFIINNNNITCSQNKSIKIITNTNIDNYIYSIIYE